jgi:hypothetical protein
VKGALAADHRQGRIAGKGGLKRHRQAAVNASLTISVLVSLTKAYRALAGDPFQVAVQPMDICAKR